MTLRPFHSSTLRLRFRTVVLALAIGLLCIVVSPPHAAFAGDVEIVVPAYFYPGASGGLWNDLAMAAGQVPITAILNPASGPGTLYDPNYGAAIDALRAAGGRVVAYVSTSYATRAATEVIGDIDAYAGWYDLDGIFLDEMTTNGSAGFVNHYAQFYDHIKSIDSDWQVIGNPGTRTSETYLTHPAADRLLVIEQAGADYAGYTPSAWNYDHDAYHFGHLAHTTPSAAMMETLLTQAVSQNAGMVYITDDIMNNPWNTLPSYWAAEIAAVAAINENSAVPGDFDDDGDVDGDDFLVWQQGFGTLYDGNDFLIWQQNFDAGGASRNSVPEPTALLLAFVLLATVACQRVITT